MPKVEVNPQKLRECGQDIIRLEKEYEELISNLFRRMYQVPTLTEEWVGESANKYKDKIILEKDPYILYGEALQQMGVTLTNYSCQIETVAQKTNGID